MESVYWILALVVVAVLVYLGYSEMHKAPAAPAKPPSAKAARAATNQSKDDTPPRRTLSGIDMNDAFAEVDVDRSMTRVVPASAYAVPDSMFLQEFVDADKSSFRPVNKEQALKSANTRPSQHMKNGRDTGAKSRTVGLYGMAFAGRGPIDRPTNGASCISFNDTDTRQHHANEATDCLATESCPWQK